jgi:2-polyprenyl-3-methyl-5-hydroxy-6-metoxy-1,4-benzoquinol methylase
MKLSKSIYFLSSAVQWLNRSEFRCTNCGATKFIAMDKKYLVTSLRKCQVCRLMYRVPPDDSDVNYRFYQKRYTQGLVTQLPDDNTLEKLLKSQFVGTAQCYRYYISVLRRLGLRYDARIFDYGCSWGYGSWQFVHAGYEVWASEISRNRAKFAREKLGIRCLSEIGESTFDEDLRHSFDCFFSAHVLEHVPSPSRVVKLAKLALRPGGFFVALTPNGSVAFKQSDPKAWHLLWGQAHPNLIDDEFYNHEFFGEQVYLDTSPVNLDALARFATNGQQVAYPQLLGSELLCVSKC